LEQNGIEVYAEQKSKIFVEVMTGGTTSKPAFCGFFCALAQTESRFILSAVEGMTGGTTKNPAKWLGFLI